ncbi:hypothetical protein Barb6XT_00121 [Bacteroidales bacterium Barb6XT]|nr:hypothetical protein Barb6XT_00121 [Bacteroidales bacterium Barb6XT]
MPGFKKTDLLNGTTAREPVKRHQYPVFIVSPSIEPYIRARCDFCGAAAILNCLNEVFDWKPEKIPSRNCIENRVKKSGYSICKEPAYAGAEEEHARITDESMMPGSEKMLLSLGVRTERQSDVPLNMSDVKVLDISAASSRNGIGIKAVPAATQKKTGRPPLYVMSNNDIKLNRAIRESKQVHIRNIGHTTAFPVEKQYGKDKHFKACTKAIAGVRVREVMRETGCLPPLRQRSVARVMNPSHAPERSRNMQRIFASLNANERQTFDFVNTHGKTTSGLIGVFGFVNGVLKRVKPEGLSKKSIDACLKETDRILNNRNKRTVRFKSSVRGQLKRERDKPAGEKSVWNASSDMTESLLAAADLSGRGIRCTG